MLAIGNSFSVLAHRSPASNADVAALTRHFPFIPKEYLDLVAQATEVEVQHQSGQYLRIWDPLDCIEMDEGYHIRKYISDAIPIGDDGGGQVIFYMNGHNGFGLYHVGYGNLGRDDAVWISANLSDLLLKATGIDTF